MPLNDEQRVWLESFREGIATTESEYPDVIASLPEGVWDSSIKVLSIIDTLTADLEAKQGKIAEWESRWTAYEAGIDRACAALARDGFAEIAAGFIAIDAALRSGFERNNRNGGVHEQNT